MTDAIVVMSGGADSCICLFWALDKFDIVEAVTFDYGQRHKLELECARTICNEVNIEHTLINLSGWEQVKGSALLDKDTPIALNNETGLPNTFIPGRNTIFLTYASVVAYQKKCHNIVTGVCQTDYSGYPDCRDSSIKALQGALTLNLGYDIYSNGFLVESAPLNFTHYRDESYDLTIGAITNSFGMHIPYYTQWMTTSYLYLPSLRNY